uniref:RNA-binding protein 14 n=1 Tax=Sander lucioperca TaxID=283035 RepID=A0A8C9XU76_SANLU
MVKIFIGNLACNTEPAELRELFEKYGEVSECDIVKNYGFVHMNNKSEAEEAIQNLHQYELHGWAMNVEMSKGRPKSTTKLHVSNLGEGVTTDVLRAKFEEFGTVVECDIVKDYAFIHMERMEDAMDAINKLDNTAYKGKLMSVQLSTSRLRTAPGMGDHTGCYVCRSGRGPPRGPPGYGRGNYRMDSPPEADYMGSSAYSRRAPGSFAERSSAYDRERLYSSVDYYEKYRARPYGSSYFEDRRMSYLPPPPPPPSSLSKFSSIDPYDRRPLPPSSSAAAYYARDRSPIRRVPVSSAGYAYESTRLSPLSGSRSSHAPPRPKDRYAPY